MSVLHSDFSTRNGSGHSTDYGAGIESNSEPKVPPEAPRKSWLSRFSFKTRETPLTDGLSDQQVSEPENAVGVHRVLRRLDPWFGYEISALEEEARRFAVEWANEGLPRHDVVPTESLDVEQVLARRAAQVFAEWVRKVRTFLSDAIANEVETAGDFLSGVRARLEGLERRIFEVRDLIERRRRSLSAIDEIKATRARDQIDIQLESQLSRVGFWVVMITLVLADFVANAPLFGELLPKPGNAEVVLQNLERSVASGYSYGMVALAGRILVHPEAAFLALAVVVFLLTLCDWFGRELRVVLAPSTKDRRLNQLFGRSIWPLGLSFAGIAAVLFVLFAARATIQNGSEARFANAQGALTSAGTEYQTAIASGNPDRIAAAKSELDRRTREKNETEERLGYARTVRLANLPILGLNAGLVLTAMMAGYYSREGRVVLDPTPLPVVEPKEEDISHSRTVALAEINTAYQDLRRGEAALERARHLSLAKPFRNAKELAERLRRVVPLFRAENARLRRLDPWDIRAFHNEPPSYLGDVDTELGFDLPRAIGDLEKEVFRLRDELARVQADEALGRKA